MLKYVIMAMLALSSIPASAQKEVYKKSDGYPMPTRQIPNGIEYFPCWKSEVFFENYINRGKYKVTYFGKDSNFSTSIAINDKGGLYVFISNKVSGESCVTFSVSEGIKPVK